MALIYLDGVARGAAIALFLLLAWRFARDWQRGLTARLGALTTLGGACYVALIGMDAVFGFINPWRLPVHVLSLATPTIFWLFTASWFDDEFELRWWHWVYLAAIVITGFAANFLWAVGLPDWLFWPIAYSWRTLSTVAVVLALVATVRGWADDLVEARRRVRIVIVVAASIAILWIVFSEVAVRGWPQPPILRLVSAMIMMLLAGLTAGATLGWRDPALLAAPERRPSGGARGDTDDGPLLGRLDHEMRHERLYRQDGLTITAVAARLGVPEYRLRRAINQGLGARNFNAYLNGFRLEESCEALADPEQREVPILTIALDAGFGSLAPFNRAFRAAQGCTPSEYRARALIELSKPTG